MKLTMKGKTKKKMKMTFVVKTIRAVNMRVVVRKKVIAMMKA